MDQLFENAEEFLASGEDNMKKGRHNAAVSDFFKAIVILCDHKIYLEMKVVPKNHNERFLILGKRFPTIYQRVSELFKIYIRSYNLKMSIDDTNMIREYAYEFKRTIKDKD